MVNFMLIALAKSKNTRGASHQPAFMRSCLTISHTMLPCLPIGRIYSCVPGFIEVGTFSSTCGVWVGLQCIEFVTADWCYKEVVNLDQTVRNLTCCDADCYQVQ